MEVQTLLLTNQLPHDVCYKIYYKLASLKLPSELKEDILLYKNIDVLIEDCYEERITLKALRHYMLHHFVLDHKFTKTSFVVSDIKAIWCMLYPDEKTKLINTWKSNKENICMNYYDTEDSYDEIEIDCDLTTYMNDISLVCDDDDDDDDDIAAILWPPLLKYCIKN